MIRKIFGVILLILNLIPFAFLAFLIYSDLKAFDGKIAEHGLAIAITGDIILYAIAGCLIWLLTFFGLKLLRSKKQEQFPVTNMPDMFNFEYTITKKDYFNFSLYHQLHSLPSLLVILIMLIIINLISFIGYTDISTLIAKMFIFTFIYLIFISLMLLLSSYVNISKNKNRFLFEEQKLLMNQNGISEQSENFKGEYSWQHLLKIVRTDKYYYLYLNQHQAIVIAKRNFKTPEEEVIFVGFLKKSRPDLF